MLLAIARFSTTKMLHLRKSLRLHSVVHTCTWSMEIILIIPNEDYSAAQLVHAADMLGGIYKYRWAY